MKKLCSVILTLAMLCTLAVPAFAVESTEVDIADIATSTETPEEIVTEKGGVAGQVNVLWNNECLKFTGVAPEIKNSRTMIPVRAVMEGMDGTVEYNHADKSVSITMGNKNAVVTFVIGSQTATVSEGGEDTTITLDCASYLKNNSTMVPLRFLSEACGYTVLWDQACKTAVVVDRDQWAKDADALMDKFNDVFISAVNAEKPEIAQLETTFRFNVGMTDDATKEVTEFTVSGQETTYVQGLQMYGTGKLDLTGLYDYLKSFNDPDLEYDLGDLLTVLKNNPSATPYGLLLDAKGDIYLNMGLINTLVLDLKENTWIKLGSLSELGVDVSAMEKPASIGCVLADNVLASTYVQENAIHAYDYMAITTAVMTAIFGDQNAASAGNGGYTWSLDTDKLAGAAGQESQNAISISTTLFPDSTGKISGKLNLDTFNGSFNLVNGKDKASLDMDAAITVESVGKYSFVLDSVTTIKTSGVKAPSFTVPAGAPVVTLEEALAQLMVAE